VFAKTKKSKTSKSVSYIILYFYMLVILLALLTVASYTWFSISRTPSVNDIAMYINTPMGLEISLSPDSGEWGKRLSFADMVPETSPLRPATWSEKDQKFYGVMFGMDGRPNGSLIPLSDDQNANRDHYEGYYCVGTFYARTDDAVRVSLTPAVAVEEDGTMGAGTFVTGTPIWNYNTLSHDNGGKGAEYAIRIGIQVHRLDQNHRPTDEPPQFFIYEPNSDTHIGDTVGYVDTPGVDGTPTLVDPDRIFAQSTTTWTDVSPAQRNKQTYVFGEFTEDTEMFILRDNETVMIRLYIWLEGQDADCCNVIADAQITANIQFLAQSYNESGMGSTEESESGKP